jgi:AcrR family transcriptional regulator
MARLPSITDEELLRYARDVFLEHGIRATTAEVAARAGVSEALIFKRFRTKDRLFVSAMQADLAPHEVAWLTGWQARVGHGDLRENLVEIGIEAVRFFRKLMPLIMMSWSNLSEEELARHHAHREAPPFVSRRLVEAYFEAERRRGRVRAGCDTEVLARLYVGALFNHASWEVMLGAHDPRPLGAEAYVRGIVDLLWRGIAPAEG